MLLSYWKYCMDKCDRGNILLFEFIKYKAQQTIAFLVHILCCLLQQYIIMLFFRSTETGLNSCCWPQWTEDVDVSLRNSAFEENLWMLWGRWSSQHIYNKKLRRKKYFKRTLGLVPKQEQYFEKSKMCWTTAQICAYCQSLCWRQNISSFFCLLYIKKTFGVMFYITKKLSGDFSVTKNHRFHALEHQKYIYWLLFIMDIHII